MRFDDRLEVALQLHLRYTLKLGTRLCASLARPRLTTGVYRTNVVLETGVTVIGVNSIGASGMWAECRVEGWMQQRCSGGTEACALKCAAPTVICSVLMKYAVVNCTPSVWRCLRHTRRWQRNALARTAGHSGD